MDSWQRCNAGHNYSRLSMPANWLSAAQWLSGQTSRIASHMWLE